MAKKINAEMIVALLVAGLIFTLLIGIVIYGIILSEKINNKESIIFERLCKDQNFTFVIPNTTISTPVCFKDDNGIITRYNLQKIGEKLYYLEEQK